MRQATAILGQLMASGLTPEQSALVAELTAAVSVEARPIVDEGAERRRAADRERKRAARMSSDVRGIPQMSADCADGIEPALLLEEKKESKKVEEKKSARPKRAPPAKASLEADWSPPSEFMEFAQSHRDLNFPDMQLTDKEILNEGCKIRDWSNRSGAKGRKSDWFGTWRTWIQRAAPEIFERRIRAERARNPAQRHGPPQSRFAPNVSMFDALAIAGASGGPGAGEGREPPSVGPREPLRVVGAEILDPGDDRGTEAGRAGGNRRAAGAPLFPLPAAAIG